MIKVDSRPFKVIKHLTTVKHFLAVLIAVVFVQLSAQAGESLKCVNVLSSPSSRNSSRDGQEHSRGAEEFLQRTDLQSEYLIKSTNIVYMGILGRIFDISYDPILKKNFVTQDKMFYDEVKRRTVEMLEISNHKIRPEILGKIQELLHVKNLTDNSVMIQFSLIKHVKSGRDLDDALVSRFTNMYMQIANWTYRLSGLVENKPISSASMQDEIVAEMHKRMGFDFHLVFDKPVWEAQLKVLQLWIFRYMIAPDPAAKANILLQIASAGEPLLPFAGVASTKSTTPGRDVPRELKRYFKNAYEDPMNLLDVKEKKEYELRHRMIYHAVELMPPGTEVEIHAHSKLHVKAYFKGGFVKVGEIENPLFPGVVIHLLRAKREEVLAKTKAILDKLQ